MSIPNWNDLLPKFEAIEAMPVEKLKRANQVASQSVLTLSHGISGLGNLLAGAADNDEMGLSDEAVANVGWMLSSLGALIASLHDTAAGMANRLHELERGGFDPLKD